MAGVLTFAEHRDAKLRRASLEAICEARRLADALGAKVSSVLIGPGVRALAGEAAHYGADHVHVFEDAALAAYATEAYASALAQVIEEVRPAVVLMPFTAMGKDLAPRVAARIGCGLASDCAALSIEEGRLWGAAPHVRRQGLRQRALGGRAADGHAASQRLRLGRAGRFAHGAR